MSSKRILELANTIHFNTEKIDAHLTLNGLPTPSFAADNPPKLLFGHGPELDAARQSVVDATDELHALMLGPTGLLSSLFVRAPSEPGINIANFMKHNSLLSVQAIIRFNLNNFPHGKEEVTFGELAADCELSEPEVRRLLRHAMAYRIFHEPRKGYVAHTAASKRLSDPLMKAWLCFVTDELWPSAVKTVDALQKWPDVQEPDQTSFNLANNTTGLFFDENSKDAARETRYADAMGWFSSAPGFEPTGLVEGIPWEKYQTVVDVGGNTGLVSQAIAKKYPSVRFIVQDRTKPIAEGIESLAPEFKERITFMVHDFFEEQPIIADVYLLRWILHDWSDRYAIKILRALILALKNGAKVVLNEFVLPPPGVASAFLSRSMRSVNSWLLTRNFY